MSLRSLLALLLLSSCVSLHRPLPSEFDLGDMDGDGDLDERDIKAAMAACGEYYAPGQGGCTIRLPGVVIPFRHTLKIGDGDTNPVSIIFKGAGSCGASYSPAGVSGGTIWRWDSWEPAAMVEIQRGTRLQFRDLCLQLDPDMVAGGSAATYGFHLRGDPYSGDITQGLSFYNVAIHGPSSGAPPLGMAAFYITGTGTPKSAQQDKIQIVDSYIRGVDIGIRQDALQALVNHFVGGELFGYTSAMQISGGTFDVRDAIVGCDNPHGCTVFDFPFQNGAGQQETLISNVYWETWYPGTFIKIAAGWHHENLNYGNAGPIVVENSYMTNQRNGEPGTCQQKLLDAATQAMVVFTGNHLYATGDTDAMGQAAADCGFDILASNPETQPFAVIYWFGNEAHTYAGPGFLRAVLTGSKLKMMAPSVNRTGQMYNDRNLNRLRDPGE